IAGFCLLTLGAHPAQADEGQATPTEEVAPESTPTTTVVAEASAPTPEASGTTADTPAAEVAPIPDEATPVGAGSLLMSGSTNTGSGGGIVPTIIRPSQAKAAKAGAAPVIDSNIT